MENTVNRPEALARQRREMAEDYNKFQKRIGQIQREKATKMVMLMAEHGTKAKADVYFNATPEGLELIELTYQCKGLLELMRATKTELDLMNAEQFGRL